MTLCKIKNVCEWLQLCKASLFVLITTLPAYLNCATCMLVTQMMAGVRGLLLCFTMLFSAGNCNGEFNSALYSTIIFFAKFIYACIV